MQAALLIGTYIVTTAVVQFLGFLVSQAVQYEWPTAGLMTFLILFLGAFGLAWPIAVRITEFMLTRAGIKIEQTDTRAI